MHRLKLSSIPRVHHKVWRKVNIAEAYHENIHFRSAVWNIKTLKHGPFEEKIFFWDRQKIFIQLFPIKIVIWATKSNVIFCKRKNTTIKKRTQRRRKSQMTLHLCVCVCANFTSWSDYYGFNVTNCKSLLAHRLNINQYIVKLSHSSIGNISKEGNNNQLYYNV